MAPSAAGVPIRTHTLYVSSRHRDADEEACRQTIELPEGIIRMQDCMRQVMKVSLASFSFNSSWYELNDSHNKFTVTVGGTSYDVVLDCGNYPFDHLAKTVTKALATAAVSCKYDVPSGKLVFTSAEPFQLDFTDESWEVLGFTSAFPVGSILKGGLHTLRSDVPLQGRREADLFMCLRNVINGDGCWNFSNHAGRLMNITDILAPIPVSAEPFTHQHTDMSTLGQLCGVYIGNEKLTALDLAIVDGNGFLATWISEWHAVLKVEIFDSSEADDGVQRSLERLERLLESLLRLKVIGKPQA